MRRRVQVLGIALTAAVAAGSCARMRVWKANDRAASAAILREVEPSRAPDYVRNDRDGRRLWNVTREFYNRRDYELVWLKNSRPGSRMEALIESVKGAEREGLDPSLYNIETVEQRRDGAGQGLLRAKGFKPEEAGRMDVWLTYLYLQYASDLADGLSDLAHADPGWRIQPETFDPVARLDRALTTNQIVESLEELKPTNPQYVALRNLLADYRTRATDGAAMDAAAKQRIHQIELNLERWRWLPRDLGSTHIIVNIPAYRLDVWEQDKVALSMRVVVGKKETPTPIFNDAMTHLVFSPYWNVPPTIAKNETLPSALRDPSFLQRTNMEVLDAAGNLVDPASIDPSRAENYRFRQRPGTQNSLGLVKFMFPNQFNVYLHDTPADSLFARASRSFSHGCVRLQEPQALAEYVLRDQPEWTADRIAEAMQAGDERTVKLREPLPVYLGYWTADVTPDGTVQFRPDVYGVDARQTAKLSARLLRLRQTARIAAN